MRLSVQIAAVLIVLLGAGGSIFFYLRSVVIEMREQRLAKLRAVEDQLRRMEVLDANVACQLVELEVLGRESSRGYTVDCLKATLELGRFKGFAYASSPEDAILGRRVLGDVCMARTQAGWGVVGCD